MPLPNTQVPTYPNVPQTSGVPPVLRQLGSVQNTVVLLTADALEVLGLFQGPQWGLFTSDGQPAFSSPSTAGLVQAIVNTLTAGGQANGQSVMEVDFRLDHQISTAPQEQGAFQSYNKVSTPFDGRVSYAISGTASQRQAFLQLVLAAQTSLTLFSLVMPEITYTSCNIVHHDFRRNAEHGVTMFVVDVWVEQVRVAPQPQFTNTTTPAGASPVNGGVVSPQTANVPGGAPT